MTYRRTHNHYRIGILINQIDSLPNKKALDHRTRKRHVIEGAQKLCRPLVLRSWVFLKLPTILNRCKDSKDIGNLQAKLAKSALI